LTGRVQSERARWPAVGAAPAAAAGIAPGYKAPVWVHGELTSTAFLGRQGAKERDGARSDSSETVSQEWWAWGSSR
jgi:hypothetical protein